LEGKIPELMKGLGTGVKKNLKMPLKAKKNHLQTQKKRKK
jgi:hypothetical protein